MDDKFGLDKQNNFSMTTMIEVSSRTNYELNMDDKFGLDKQNNFSMTTMIEVSKNTSYLSCNVRLFSAF